MALDEFNTGRLTRDLRFVGIARATNSTLNCEEPGNTEQLAVGVGPVYSLGFGSGPEIDGGDGRGTAVMRLS